MTMKLKKSFLLGVLTLVLAFALVGCSSKGENTDGNEGTKGTVIAVVGDTEIMQSEVDKQMDYIKNTMKAQFGEEYDQNPQVVAYLEQQEAVYIKYLVETELLLQKAEALGLAATEEEINNEFETSKAGYTTLEDFQKALETNGYTEETYKERITEGLIINQLITQYTENVTVTDEAVKEYYDANQARFTNGAGAEMFHILVATEEEAKKVKAEYEAGTSFADLAAQYGTDGTKTNGGSLGYIPYDSPNYDADFLAGAKPLAEGEVSEPIKTQFGYHLIKVENVQAEPIVEPYENVSVLIHEELLKQEKEKVIAAEIEKIQEEITVEYKTAQADTTEEK